MKTCLNYIESPCSSKRDINILLLCIVGTLVLLGFQYSYCFSQSPQFIELDFGDDCLTSVEPQPLLQGVTPSAQLQPRPIVTAQGSISQSNAQTLSVMTRPLFSQQSSSVSQPIVHAVATLPRPYWNGNIENANEVILIPVQNQLSNQLAVPLTNNTAANLPLATNQPIFINPIRQASGNISLTENSTTLATAGNTQFGSIPSGTPVILLAQNTPGTTISSTVPGAPVTVTNQFPIGTSPSYAPTNGSLSPSASPGAPGPGFDAPYNTPNSGTFLGQSTHSSTSVNGSSTGFDFEQSYDTMKRFLDQLAFEYRWMPKNGSHPLGLNQLTGSARFGIPCRHLGDTTVYVSPGVQMNFWNFGDNAPIDAFDTTFGTWIDAGFEQSLPDRWRFSLWGKVGIYGDYKKLGTNCIYVQGQGSAYYIYNNTTQIVLGVTYINRQHVKLLPVAGFIWRPNPDVEWRLVFPDPRLSRRLGEKMGNTEWWGYVRGDYGGGSWGIKDHTGETVMTDYNDIRVALGLEFRNPEGCLSGNFEVGGAFDREIYSGGRAWYRPSNTIFLGGTLVY